jgi:hypothetical protein
MRQFYTMHEHIYTEIRECKKINKISLLTKNTQTKPNIIIRQKQSLVHKVPSGVAILSHVCGVAMKTSPLKIYLMWQMWETRNSCLLLVEKRNGSRHLTFGSLGTLTGIKDRVQGLVA